MKQNHTDIHKTENKLFYRRMYTAFTLHIKNHLQKDRHMNTHRERERHTHMNIHIENFTCKNTNCVKPSFIKVCYCRFYTVFFVNFKSACMQATIFSNAKEPKHNLEISELNSSVVCVAAVVVFAFCWYGWCRELKPQCGRLFFYSLVLDKMLLIRFMQVECLCMCECVSMQCIEFIKTLHLPWI